VCGELYLIDYYAVDAALNFTVYDLLHPLFADIERIVSQIDCSGDVLVLKHAIYDLTAHRVRKSGNIFAQLSFSLVICPNQRSARLDSRVSGFLGPDW